MANLTCQTENQHPIHDSGAKGRTIVPNFERLGELRFCPPLFCFGKIQENAGFLAWKQNNTCPGIQG